MLFWAIRMCAELKHAVLLHQWIFGIRLGVWGFEIDFEDVDLDFFVYRIVYLAFGSGNFLVFSCRIGFVVMTLRCTIVIPYTLLARQYFRYLYFAQIETVYRESWISYEITSYSAQRREDVGWPLSKIQMRCRLGRSMGNGVSSSRILACRGLPDEKYMLLCILYGYWIYFAWFLWVSSPCTPCDEGSYVKT